MFIIEDWVIQIRRIIYPKIFEISPHPSPLPAGERGRVRGEKC
jgi:hypothetical protein